MWALDGVAAKKGIVKQDILARLAVNIPSRPAKSRWWVVFGSFVGLIFSTGPVLQFTFGLFIKPVGEAFQADRSRVSLGLLVALCLSGLLTPIAGRLVDRFGVRRAGMPLIALFALALALIGVASRSIWTFVFCYACAGVLGAGQTPLIYAKAITSVFGERRGLALGAAMAGVGVGMSVVPKLTQLLIAALGWRGAYVILGAATLLVSLPAVGFFVHERPCANSVLGMSGLTGAQAIRSRTFWTLATAFCLAAAASAGLMAHIVPMMTDRGVPSQTAALALSTGGAALISGRLIAGYLIDRVFAPYVALFFFAMPLIAIMLLLSTADLTRSVLAIGLVGMGLGAELDLMAYVQSRYFGTHCFGEIYGYFLTLFMIGSGIGPYVMGFSYMRTGHYSVALIVFACGLVLACAFMLTLRGYPYGKG